MWIWPKLKQQEANSPEHEAKFVNFRQFLSQASVHLLFSHFILDWLLFPVVLSDHSMNHKNFEKFFSFVGTSHCPIPIPTVTKEVKCPLKEQYYGKALCTNYCRARREKFSKTHCHHHQILFLYIWGLTLQPIFTLT